MMTNNKQIKYITDWLNSDHINDESKVDEYWRFVSDILTNVFSKVSVTKTWNNYTLQQKEKMRKKIGETLDSCFNKGKSISDTGKVIYMFMESKMEKFNSFTKMNEASKVKEPAKLSQQVISELTDRLKDEYTAHYFYRAAANWCKDMNYANAAVFFDVEADTELTHAKKLQDYATSWNVILEIPQTTTKYKFEDLVDVINRSYEVEFDLLKKYNHSSKLVMGEDLNTFDFFKELRDIQKDSVSEYADLLNALNLVDSTNKFELLYFERTYMAK
jgi:ferritin